MVPLPHRDCDDRTGTLITSALPPPTLPFDLVAEILYRLPVKLLIQLRCLCKSFNSLVSDPKFAIKHLHVSKTRQTQLSYPDRLKIEYDSPLFARSCNGILCFTMYNGPDVSPPILWNPSIRTFKILLPLDNKALSAYSFGYDHCIDKYKIVAVSLVVEDETQVSVHTLGTDTWRRIPDFPSFGPCRGYGIFVSGTVNWLSFDDVNSSFVIVSLDLENESYQTLSLPDFEKDPLTNLGDLGVLRDCLCFFTSSDMFFDVLIMNEYGNKKSWTRLYCVPYMKDRGLCHYTKALYISEDEQLLMDFKELESGKLKLVVYDSKDGTLKIPEHWWLDAPRSLH